MTEVEGPLSERAVHKVWKVRLAAYEELEKIFNVAEEGDPKFNEFGTYSKLVQLILSSYLEKCSYR